MSSSASECTVTHLQRSDPRCSGLFSWPKRSAFAAWRPKAAAAAQRAFAQRQLVRWLLPLQVWSTTTVTRASRRRSGAALGELPSRELAGAFRCGSDCKWRVLTNAGARDRSGCAHGAFAHRRAHAVHAAPCARREPARSNVLLAAPPLGSPASSNGYTWVSGLLYALERGARAAQIATTTGGATISACHFSAVPHFQHPGESRLRCAAAPYAARRLERRHRTGDAAAARCYAEVDGTSGLGGEIKEMSLRHTTYYFCLK